MDPVGVVFWSVILFAFAMLILYLVIACAVASGLAIHEYWTDKRE